MTTNKFDKIIACLDMAGCPNRCKHCWLGVTANGNLSDEDLLFVANQFRPFTEKLEVASWYREPDYKSNYKELWQLEEKLSDEKIPHFENISIWRTARDAEYVKWISSLGVKACQLTLFGNEETTDYYFGRKGAFSEILKTIDILLENNIAPRIQVFVNKNNIEQLPFIAELIEKLDLEKRCADIVQEFAFFLHQGSCEGENEKLYDVWVTPSDIEKIPQKLVDFSLKHWGKEKIKDIFGRTEQDLYAELITDNSTERYVSKTVVFYIDKDFNVYPNISNPAPYWCLGSLKIDGVETVIDNYINSKSIAQNARLNIPIYEMVKKCGTKDSQRLFTKGDYIAYILNQYCKE